MQCVVPSSLRHCVSYGVGCLRLCVHTTGSRKMYTPECHGIRVVAAFGKLYVKCHTIWNGQVSDNVCRSGCSTQNKWKTYINQEIVVGATSAH